MAVVRGGNLYAASDKDRKDKNNEHFLTAGVKTQLVDVISSPLFVFEQNILQIITRIGCFTWKKVTYKTKANLNLDDILSKCFF